MVSPDKRVGVDQGGGAELGVVGVVVLFAGGWLHCAVGVGVPPAAYGGVDVAEVPGVLLVGRGRRGGAFEAATDFQHLPGGVVVGVLGGGVLSRRAGIADDHLSHAAVQAIVAVGGSEGVVGVELVGVVAVVPVDGGQAVPSVVAGMHAIGVIVWFGAEDVAPGRAVERVRQVARAARDGGDLSLSRRAGVGVVVGAGLLDAVAGERRPVARRPERPGPGLAARLRRPRLGQAGVGGMEDAGRAGIDAVIAVPAAIEYGHVVRSDDAATTATPLNCAPAHHHAVTLTCPSACVNQSLAISQQRFLTAMASQHPLFNHLRADPKCPDNNWTKEPGQATKPDQSGCFARIVHRPDVEPLAAGPDGTNKLRRYSGIVYVQTIEVRIVPMGTPHAET